MKKGLLYFIFIGLCWMAMGGCRHDSKASLESGEDFPLVAVSSHSDTTVFHADNLTVYTSGSDEVTISPKRFYYNSFLAGLLFIGSVGLLSFFILVLYVKSGERIYLYYFLFLIFSLLGGYINQSNYDWSNWSYQSSSVMARRTLETVTLLALFSYCIFTLKLLEVKKQAPRLANWITALAAVNAVYGCVYWFIYPLVADKELILFIISRAVILPMSLVAIVWVTSTVHSVFKSYFIIGSAFYFTGAFLAVLRQVEVYIPFKSFYNISSTTYFQAGIFLEIVCFALALSHRIYLLYTLKQQEQEIIRKRAVQERDIALAEVLSSRMRSNPHFIFNSLNAIKYRIQNKQNEKAVKILTGYSRFIRTVLNTGIEPLISLSEELKIIRQYLQMESDRYDKVLNYAIRIHEGIDSEKIFIPPMLLLPFIEQAIWTSLSEEVNNGNLLSIEVNRDQVKTIVTIENGKGQQIEKFHRTDGEKIHNERIELYNKNHLNKINCFTNVHNETDKGMVDGAVVLTIEHA